MQKRKQPPCKPLKLSDKEISTWHELIFKYYKDSKIIPNNLETYLKENGKTFDSDSLNRFVEIIVAECIKGWPRAPGDMGGRVGRKTGYNSNFNKKDTVSIKKNTKSDKINDNHIIAIDVGMKLSKAESDFYESRMSKYIDDFDFNESSDFIPLKKLVFEEIVYDKLIKKHLKIINSKEIDFEEAESISKLVTDSHKRMSDLQKQLGISRTQRADELNRGANSIAEMSLMFEDKIKKYPDLREKLKIEENFYQSIKNLEIPVNIVPEQKELETMLSSETSQQIYEGIINKAVEQIQKDAVKDVPKENDLPTGGII